MAPSLPALSASPAAIGDVNCFHDHQAADQRTACVATLPATPADAPETLNWPNAQGQAQVTAVVTGNELGAPSAWDIGQMLATGRSTLLSIAPSNGKQTLLLRTQSTPDPSTVLGNEIWNVPQRGRELVNEAATEHANTAEGRLAAAQVLAARYGYTMYTSQGDGVFRKLSLEGVNAERSPRTTNPQTLSTLARLAAHDTVAKRDRQYSPLTFHRPTLEPGVPTRDHPLIFEAYAIAEMRGETVSPRAGVNLNLRLDKTLDSLIQINVEGNALRTQTWFSESRASEALRGHVSWQPEIFGNGRVNLAGLATVGGELADDRPRAAFERGPATAYVEGGASLNAPLGLPYGMSFGSDLALRGEFSNHNDFRMRAIPVRYSMDLRAYNWPYKLSFGATFDVRAGAHRPEIAAGGFVSSQLNLPWGTRMGFTVDMRSGHLGDVGEIEPLSLYEPAKMPLNPRFHLWLAQDL